MVDGYPEVDEIQRLKTDVFRDRVRYAEDVKAKLAKARREGQAAVAAVERELGDVGDVEASILIDLFLSYRAVKDWKGMIDLAGRMPRPLAVTVMVREQLGLALNRAGRGEDAERELLDLIGQRGGSSETYGILGRVYKDRWEQAVDQDEDVLARGLLDKAIDTYLKGFETDWRDAYPGVNAATLMEMKDPVDTRQAELLPIVSYAVERRIAQGQPDYWDHATRLELAVLARDREAAETALANAAAVVREVWEPETTARNLNMIVKVRQDRDEDTGWVERIMKVLDGLAESKD
jgi:hypothetical protein